MKVRISAHKVKTPDVALRGDVKNHGALVKKLNLVKKFATSGAHKIKPRDIAGCCKRPHGSTKYV
jgi:hypothetical protein